MDELFTGKGPLATLIDDVDRQHADLYRRTKKISVSLASMKRIEGIRPAINDLLAELGDHFASEERLFHVLDPKRAALHRKEHVQLAAALKSYAENLKKLTPDEAYKAFIRLEDSLTKHIVLFDLDLRYAKHGK